MFDRPQRFEIERVVALRERATKARLLTPDRLQRWVKSPVDPMVLASVFAPAVRVREGWVLRAYRLSGGLGGGGRVFAMRSDAPFPEPDTCMTRVGNAEVPSPPGASSVHEPAFTDAIEIDGRAWSYLSLSLLLREAGAFGEEWHAIEWGNRKLVGDRSDAELADLTLAKNAAWPSDFRPEVAIVDGAIEVAFYVFSAHLFRRMWREVDRYEAGTLHRTRREEAIAVGGRGFVY